MKNWKKKKKKTALKIQKSERDIINKKYYYHKKLKIKIVDNILERSINNFNKFNKENQFNKEFATDYFKLKIQLNYIRHTLTNYDILIKNMNNYIDKDKFKEFVNSKIIEKYKEKGILL